MCNCEWGSGGRRGGGDLWSYIQVGYISVCASFSSQSICLGGVLKDFNKSIHKIHNLSCITLWLILLVCWLGVFLPKVTRYCDNFQYCKKGESFH